MEKKTQTAINSFIVNEIRNTGFEQEVDSLPVGDESSPKTLLWFSMTAINKLGVNPQSTYDTPIGIYCYPLTEEYKEKLFTGNLPFAARQPYIQVFGVKPSTKMLELAKYSQENYNQDLEKLRAKFENTFENADIKQPQNIVYEAFVTTIKKAKEILSPSFTNSLFDILTEYTLILKSAHELNQQLRDSISHEIRKVLGGKNVLNMGLTFYVNNPLEEDLEKLVELFIKKFFQNVEREINNPTTKEQTAFEKFVTIAERDAKIQSHAGFIWNVTRLIASKVQSNRFDENNPGGARASITWTTILKTVLGYDCVYDNGQGIIHKNEPTQMVVFNFKVINFKQTILNNHSSTDLTMSDHGIKDKSYKKNTPRKTTSLQDFISNFKDDFKYQFQGTPFTARNILEKLDQLVPSLNLLILLSLFPHNITEQELKMFEQVNGPLNSSQILRTITKQFGHTARNYVRHFREPLEQQLANKIQVKNYQVLYTYSDVVNKIPDTNLRQFVVDRINSLLPSFLPVYQTIDEALEAAEQTKDETKISWFVVTQTWKHSSENPKLVSQEKLNKFSTNLINKVINYIATNILKYQNYPTVMSWLNKQDLSYKQ